MGIKHKLAALLGASLLVLTGCADNDEPKDETTPSTSSSVSISTQIVTSTSESSPPETTALKVEPSSAGSSVAVESASPTATYVEPGAQYGEICWSGTPDQWPNYVDPATGCGGFRNPDYVEPVAEREFVECIHGGGAWTSQAWYNDGSYGWHADCQALRDAQLAENPYQCPGTDAQVPDSSYCTQEYLNAPVTDEIIQQQEELGRQYQECLDAGNTNGYCLQIIYY